MITTRQTEKVFLEHLWQVMAYRDSKDGEYVSGSIQGYLQGLIRGYEMATGKKVAFNPLAEDGENPYSIIDKEERK